MLKKEIEKYTVYVKTNSEIISKLELNRWSNPLLVEKIIRNLPSKFLVFILGSKILFKIGIPQASARKIYKHQKGDISYDPLHESLVIYTKEEQDHLENIGKVIEGMENLEKIKTGIFLTLEKS